jgi:hypothetical protein
MINYLSFYELPMLNKSSSCNNDISHDTFILPLNEYISINNKDNNYKN